MKVRITELKTELRTLNQKPDEDTSLIKIRSKLSFLILFLRKSIKIAENRVILTPVFSTIPL